MHNLVSTFYAKNFLNFFPKPLDNPARACYTVFNNRETKKGVKAMTNENIFRNLISFYTSRAFTDNYIFGFTLAGMVYMVTINHADDVLPYVMNLDKASRGQGYALRFKPNKAQKAVLMESGDIKALCSMEYFEECVNNSKYNKGEIFEKMVTESFGLTWEKDNVPYTDAGDIRVGQIDYQIKFEKATFTNEKSMMLMA